MWLVHDAERPGGELATFTIIYLTASIIYCYQPFCPTFCRHAVFTLLPRTGAVRKKGTSIEESAPGSALTVQEPESGQQSFLTWQKFIRPSDGRSEAGNWPSPHPVNCPDNNAQ